MPRGGGRKMPISGLRWRGRCGKGGAGGFDRDGVGGGVAVFTGDGGEPAGVVQHGPADIVLFESGADVVDPRGAIGWAGSATIDAEFVTGKRDVPALTPCGGFGDFCINACGIPAVETVTLDGLLVDRIGNLRVRGGYVFRRRRIRKIRQIVLKIGGPGCALVRENVWIVKMEIVNDIGIVKRFERKKFV